MKFIFLVSITLIVSATSVAQMRYSTKNKKAIKLYEQGQQAPNLSIDEKYHIPNYREGIVYLKKALEKDSTFWEAHLLLAEFAELIRDYPLAISHYEKALTLNPDHSQSGGTYYYLANLLQITGNYERSNTMLDAFTKNRNANPDLVNKAYFMQSNNDFAINALKNPSAFEPVNVGPGVNTADPEYYPTLTVDGKTLLFTRRIKDQRVQQIGEQEDFYVSQLSKEKRWGTAVAMPANINTTLNEGAPTISADGRSLIFVACSDQSDNNYYGDNRTGRGSCDLFFTKKIGSSWTNPVNLSGNINTFNWESQPSLSADGKTLYFIRRVSRRGEPNNTDIFVSNLLENGAWDTPTPLPKNINTAACEESVLIHPDGKTLYFASRGHIGMGGSDIYMTTKDTKGNWSKPVNLGYPINSTYDENSLLVSADGELAFFASDRKGGYGKLDIYSFVMPEQFRPTKTLYFEGIVYDITTRKPLAGKFQLIDLETGKEVIYSEADKVNGEFVVSLPLNKEYALNVSYPGYTFFSQNFNMNNSQGLEAVHMDVPMVPISSDQPVLLANVFFDLAKSTLRKESFVELDKLTDFMVKNPTLKIEIGGHTDSRGDAKANLKLSSDRAKAVYDYIVAKGVDANRMAYAGYGSTKTVISDAEIAKLATEDEREKAHQSNRRTEYKILK